VFFFLSTTRHGPWPVTSERSARERCRVEMRSRARRARGGGSRVPREQVVSIRALAPGQPKAEPVGRENGAEFKKTREQG
jgi:hypothetical protein